MSSNHGESPPMAPWRSTASSLNRAGDASGRPTARRSPSSCARPPAPGPNGKASPRQTSTAPRSTGSPIAPASTTKPIGGCG